MPQLECSLLRYFSCVWWAVLGDKGAVICHLSALSAVNKQQLLISVSQRLKVVLVLQLVISSELHK